MSRRASAAPLAAVVLVVTLASVAAFAGLASAAATADGPSAVADGPHATADGLSSANTTIRIELQPDGDARWTVSTWFDLEDEADREAFREVADRFETGEGEDLGLAAFRRERAAVSRATGREMEIRDVEFEASSDATVASGIGRLSVSFTWTNFARTDGNGTLAVGDAFNTTDGPLLAGLTDNQTLIVVPPESYSVYSSTVPATAGTLRWEGPRTFGPDSLRATFTGSGVQTPTDDGDGTPEPDQPSTLVIAGLLGGLVLALGTVYLVARRTDVRGDAVDDGEPTAAGDPTDGAGAEAVAEPTADGADGDGVDEELLSDEERVEHLLERNDGRMKQATIVKETGWSNAKVSQLLSSMAEDDRVDKLRIGRENLISFPDEDVADVEE